eukprot:Skav218786  [mRNA]  locus=scaffold1140:13124:18327:- [translate_table: standard]
MTAHLRRSMRIQLRAVPLDVVEAAKERRDAGAIDLEPIVIESRGSKAIERMVKALAAAWQRSARQHETQLPECAFHCYAYGPEFDQQWSHFDSQMEMFKLKPQKPSSSFSEQVMFLAHVAPSFPDKAKALPDLLIGALSDHFEVMHSSMRSTLVQALILLRNRDQRCRSTSSFSGPRTKL